MNVIKTLESLLKYSITHVDFYKKLHESSLSAFPVIDKKIINKEYNRFISTIYKNDVFSGSIPSRVTTGTSGEFLKVPWSAQDEFIASNNIWKYRRSWYNIDPLDRYVSFTALVRYNNSILLDFNDAIEYRNNLIINKAYIDNEHIDNIIEKIKRFEPTWIIAQPSTLLQLLYLTNDNEWYKTIRYVELTGEVLSLKVKNYIGERIQTAKVANMYSSTESNCIALECPNGHLHVIDENVFIEHSNQNELIITSLTNTVMPFIRYNIHDRGSIYSPECDFLSNNALRISYGRSKTMLGFSNGETLDAYRIESVIEYVNEYYFDSILMYRCVVSGAKSIDLYIMLSLQYYKWEKTITKKLAEELSKNLGIYEWNVVVNYQDYLTNHKLISVK